MLVSEDLTENLKRTSKIAHLSFKMPIIFSWGIKTPSYTYCPSSLWYLLTTSSSSFLLNSRTVTLINSKLNSNPSLDTNERFRKIPLLISLVVSTRFSKRVLVSGCLIKCVINAFLLLETTSQFSFNISLICEAKSEDL